MSEFRQDLEDRLQSELDASQPEASRIARQAERYCRERGSTLTPEGIIDRMEMRDHATLTGKWNNLVAFLDGDTYNIEEDDQKDCPYKV